MYRETRIGIFNLRWIFVHVSPSSDFLNFLINNRYASGTFTLTKVVAEQDGPLQCQRSKFKYCSTEGNVSLGL